MRQFLGPSQARVNVVLNLIRCQNYPISLRIYFSSHYLKMKSLFLIFLNKVFATSWHGNARLALVKKRKYSPLYNHWGKSFRGKKNEKSVILHLQSSTNQQRENCIFKLWWQRIRVQPKIYNRRTTKARSSLQNYLAKRWPCRNISGQRTGKKME